ncbi:unnamed protein product [Brassicogethes aeneus]|uniref:Hymenoptaecin n=1 Tax=Brassicogethes aeneus TaxID=1431903 RepID=A0A9P0FNW3_BRAAE|nr:unnamed protein product [Brassicogethes aeneus]
MKFLVLFASLTVVAMAQRPSYAGLTPKLGPELASRFKNPNDTADDPILANRLGEDTPTNLPTDARGDGGLVDRLNQWPREHRPFWLINAEHIERHRHPNEGQGNSQNQQVQGNAVNLASRNNFAAPEANNGFFEVVNGVPGHFDKGADGTVNINFESRGAFGESPDTRPIKPEPPRSTFLGARN